MSVSFSGLALRIGTAIVLGPLTLALLYYGGPLFYVLIAVALGISLLEWRRMAAKLDHAWVWMVTGGLYIVGCFLCFVLVRIDFALGDWFALCLLIAVWASDSGAYFTGKILRGPKMAPRLSPNKTWSGLAGGMASCALMLLLLAGIGHHYGVFDPRGGYIVFILMAGCLFGLVGQLGDLLVSVFKRRSGVKDTGQLIPGHGGMLDRIDSVMLVAPVFLALLSLWRL